MLATALHLNAAAGTLNMKKYKEAIYNCNKALALNPASAKAYFRMAEAQHATEVCPRLLTTSCPGALSTIGRRCLGIW